MIDGNLQKLVMYVLNSCNTKLPIKSSDLNEVLGKDTKVLNQYMPQLQATLKNVYGIVMVDVPDSKSGKKYICFAECAANSPFEYDAEQQMQLTLLFLVLSFIFMTGMQPSEGEIEKYLNAMKIEFDYDHKYFGANVKKLITETFVKQLYLKRIKSSSEYDAEDKWSYTWGFRSEMEFNKLKVLEVVAQILNTTVDSFVDQYKQATVQLNTSTS